MIKIIIFILISHQLLSQVTVLNNDTYYSDFDITVKSSIPIFDKCKNKPLYEDSVPIILKEYMGAEFKISHTYDYVCYYMMLKYIVNEKYPDFNDSLFFNFIYFKNNNVDITDEFITIGKTYYTKVHAKQYLYSLDLQHDKKIINYYKNFNISSFIAKNYYSFIFFNKENTIDKKELLILKKRMRKLINQIECRYSNIKSEDVYILERIKHML
jgi:hypothetical protein